MNELRRRLVDLYSGGPVTEVQSSSAYQDLLTEHKGDRVFDAERDMVQESREWVDKRLSNKPSYKDQVASALRLLRTSKKPEQTEACRELVLQTYGTRWDANQRKYFEDKSLVIMEAWDYFLSFTNHNPARGQLNQVNKNYKYFIRKSMQRGEFERANLSERNWLAHTVDYLLRTESNLNGFYYPEHEGDNAIVEEKLRTNCLKALAFVQLVQRDIFHYNADGYPNWCFFEYEVVRQQSADRILFVQVDQNIPAETFNPAFDDWYAAFKARDPVKLTTTPTYREAVILENERKITDLAEQIQSAVDRIYLEIPD